MTLTELLVVLAILGILLLMAFPALQPLFARTHAMEAKFNLRHLAELQEMYHLERRTYGPDFSAVGFEQAALVTHSGTAHYQIELVRVDRSDFVARATSVTDFDGDGVFNVWEIDSQGVPREVTPD
ncbi:prepilin-type N-terminal cleavage/methylation domain-containing protein (plasmid) [Pontibacter sp. G13]|nr:type IV pilin protein [Pontibacter sp. G13]WNJ21621.1 prepilin-type N-terminal cleavage/methylation domain-containing protein [Pontibacter sp. G13]